MDTKSLRMLRLKNGATQAQFADAIGISQSAISRAERGLIKLTPANMAAAREFALHFTNRKTVVRAGR
jgi:transcriptional regulator with XRE-family HTH domain